MDEDSSENSGRRQRKRKLIGEVREVLEFYFSPANITKDKFMQNLINKQPYVDLEIFFRFNKIKALTDKKKILQKAVKNSSVLALSEDGNHVKRSAPLEIKENDIDCTIYVENLPPNSSHEWLRKVFARYGNIDYISLPRFQQSGRPKGFSFIEFRTPQEAQKAIESFEGLATLDGTLNPPDLLTIKTYGLTEDTDVETSVPPDPSIDSEKKVKDKVSGRKRSAEEAFDEKDNCDTEDIPEKKLKSEEKEVLSKKKKNKRKRRTKAKLYEPDSVYLRVLSKRDWKCLRNKYLNMQRENMKQLKNSWQQRNSSTRSWDSSNVVDVEGDQKMHRNSSEPEFVAGVIAKISLDDPPSDSRAFREGLTNKQYSVAYVDINSETKDVYVRFKSSEDAKKFVLDGLWENVCLLEGEEEKSYWEHIRVSWNKRRPKKKVSHTAPSSQSTTTFRGRDKLFDRALMKKSSANQHIVFEN